MIEKELELLHSNLTQIQQEVETYHDATPAYWELVAREHKAYTALETAFDTYQKRTNGNTNE